MSLTSRYGSAYTLLIPAAGKYLSNHLANRQLEKAVRIHVYYFSL